MSYGTIVSQVASQAEMMVVLSHLLICSCIHVALPTTMPSEPKDSRGGSYNTAKIQLLSSLTPSN